MPLKPQAYRPVYAPQAGRDYDRNKRRNDPALAAAAKLRSSAAWQTLRRNFTAVHPVCGCCLAGLTTSVHHVEPVVKRPDLALDWDNLAPVCNECKPRVDARERKGMETASLFARFVRRGIF